ncbi:hypothetical protein BKH42_03885 [Helicobacter sp. 13S00482-2]|uniref:TaqI-like C-terminal specificity domain-containing protein n=1 Tax=Helicobacter sp. 13S00482-2 TaxID=1476200 RepID=UPI000BA62D4C|nr:TaqI-like C-terminal specificity domain-containing protein [Helicobacter sp. 13S00482-2]PAF53883.1 hypothetical protein BKH42_03885 [Helicobacter sp. 13S00482-2]
MECLFSFFKLIEETYIRAKEDEEYIIYLNERERTEQIIRPILRGRDIKRYSYEWAGKWVIGTFPTLKLNIDEYLSLKNYLESFMPKIAQSGEKGCRKKTSNKWFETQDNIAYWNEFNRQKIVYPNMTKFLPFVYDDKGFLANQKCFILTGENIAFLSAFLNSSLFKFCFSDSFPRLGVEGRELSKIFFEKIPVIKITSNINNKFALAIDDIQREYTESKAIDIDRMIFDLYNLTEQEREFIGFIEIK